MNRDQHKQEKLKKEDVGDACVKFGQNQILLENNIDHW